MSVQHSACLFPSYRGIQQQIQKKYIQKYRNKIKGLKRHLTQLQESNDFQRDHEQIQLSIMTLSAPNIEQNQQEKETLKVVEQHQRNHISNSHHGESLNFYLEDDGEENNNFQTFLKFKKKLLERDLEEELKARGSANRHEKKKQKEQEEYFFRNLYVNDANKDPLGARKCSSANTIYRRSKGSKGSTPKYSEIRENAGSFLKKLTKDSCKSKKDLVEMGRKSRDPKRAGGIENEIAAYDKNRKILTDNYLEIVKKLEGTNIVKWRVLKSGKGESQ